MKTLSRTLSALMLLSGVALLAPGCKKKQYGCTDPAALNYDADANTDCCCAYAPASTGSTRTIITGSITSNRTLTNDQQYLLKGFVYVEDGATLTIQPGTIIHGDKATKGTLIIKRGGKIMAEGTASAPIVFTSNLEAGARDFGDWGGVIICGRATQNQPSDPTVEGGPDAPYGGTDDNDNSGILRYVRIEFAGIAFQPNQEINGLTLCAVGRGTQIDHIQVSYSGDDSYEWFGGAVQAKYLVAFRGWDDDFDTDFGYHGKVQFGLSIRDQWAADQSGSNGFESDNDASGNPYSPYTQAVFCNMSVFGPLAVTSGSFHPQFKRGAHLRRNTKLNVFNSVIAGWPTGVLIDATTTETNAANNELMFRNNLVMGNSNLEVNSGSSFDVAAWFNTAGWNNALISPMSAFGLNTPLSLTGPSLLPNAGSPLLSGSDFSWAPLTDSFFSATSFRGAFGTDDWTAGWCNWDPQNTAY